MNQRLQTLSQTLKEGEAAVILSRSNLFYYTGFDTDSGLLWVTREEACFFTDFRYTEAARRVIDDIPCVESRGFFSDTVDMLCERRIDTVLLEDKSLTLADYRAFRQKAEGMRCVTDDTLCTRIHAQRRCKDETEIACIRRAQAVTEEGFSYILSRLSVGRTEKEVALDLEMYMRAHGADSVAFDFIVASGENGALPHAVPGDRRLQRGDFVTMDFGATVDGYRSDMTRTVALGMIGEEQRLVYDTVLKAQQTCLSGLRVGMSCRDGDALARNVIKAAGYGDAFGHSTGHGVGIDIHEFPNLSERVSSELCAGDVVTVEPGIYLEGRFGVRIEDMVWMTQNGPIDLTSARKELIIL